MRKPPFHIRLYSRPAWYELARAVGYEGLPLEEARRVIRELRERHGRPVVEQAAAEVVFVDSSTDPPHVRLSEECLKWCRQLLGEPPGAVRQAEAG